MRVRASALPQDCRPRDAARRRIPQRAIGVSWCTGVTSGSPEAAPAVASEKTNDPFPVALRELLIEHDYSTASGNPNWTAFSEELRGVHYETLRRAAAGERSPSARLIEECARALRLTPDYFLEYRLHLAQRDFDPKAVGLERAVENLQRWSAHA